MEIVLGCVGKPSAGKSTFFNGVSEGKAKTGNFPFTTIEPNVGISYYRVDCPCVRKVRRARTHGTHGRGETCHREGNPHGICRCGVLFVVAGEVSTARPTSLTYVPTFLFPAFPSRSFPSHLSLPPLHLTQGKTAQCAPKYGWCDGERGRFIPVKLMDVAGLIPGASEGAGLGNKVSAGRGRALDRRGLVMVAHFVTRMTVFPTLHCPALLPFPVACLPSAHTYTHIHTRTHTLSHSLSLSTHSRIQRTVREVPERPLRCVGAPAHRRRVWDDRRKGGGDDWVQSY